MAKILLMNNKDLLRKGVRNILESSELEVIEADIDTEALGCFSINTVDRVIPEILMTHLEGHGFISQLRESFIASPLLTKSGSSNIFCPQFGLDALLLSGANDSLTQAFTALQRLEKLTHLRSTH